MCKYCEGWPTEHLYNTRTDVGKKSGGYPGLEVYIDIPSNVMWIGGHADVYEPNFIEAEIEINYCPMCGRKLNDEETE